jgi:molybdopterin molybdotransferase
MITPEQAEILIHSRSLALSVESISLHQALNRVLAEELVADTDLPPFNRVMMDGIALCYRAIENGHTHFPIQAMQRAGEAPLTLESEDYCIEIMTGAVCSSGCDTVVPYEHIRIENGIAYIDQLPGAKGKNIHLKGSDKKRGEVLVPEGKRIGPAEIGIASSVGKETLRVLRKPRVLICSTGDELVDIHETPLAYQIRRSNVYALMASLQSLGIEADNVHLPDEKEQLERALEEALKSYDAILLSGGVSKGKFDLLPDVLRQLGIETIFHGIAQRPGKPMWFGYSETCTVFALPGNPVSTLTCAARYVLPWFKKQLGLDNQTMWTSLEEIPAAHDTLCLFLPVKLSHTQQGPVCQVQRYQGSGDFSALFGIHGFIEVAAGKSSAPNYRYFPI